MKLASGSTNYADGPLGMVELVASYVDDREFRKFSRPEIIEYLNLGQLALASDINGLNREFFTSTEELNTVAGQAQYDLPADCARLMGLDIADASDDDEPSPVVSVHMNDAVFYQGLDAAQAKSDFRYFFVAGTSVTLLPGPSSSGKKIRVHKIARLDRLEANEDESVIPADHHELVVFQGVRRCFVKKGKTHESVERLYEEGLSRMKRDLTNFVVQREDRIEPFYGSFGPVEQRRRDVW